MGVSDAAAILTQKDDVAGVALLWAASRLCYAQDSFGCGAVCARRRRWCYRRARLRLHRKWDGTCLEYGTRQAFEDRQFMTRLDSERTRLCSIMHTTSTPAFLRRLASSD